MLCLDCKCSVLWNKTQMNQIQVCFSQECQRFRCKRSRIDCSGFFIIVSWFFMIFRVFHIFHVDSWFLIIFHDRFYENIIFSVNFHKSWQIFTILRDFSRMSMIVYDAYATSLNNGRRFCYTYAHTHKCTYAHTFTRTLAYTHARLHTHIHTHAPWNLTVFHASGFVALTLMQYEN